MSRPKFLIRDKVDVIWNDQLTTPNLFRIWEILFGRKRGIRCEHAIDFWMEDGKIYKKYHLYSFESKVSFMEKMVRTYINSIINKTVNTFKYWNWKLNKIIPQICGVFIPQFSFVGFATESATEEKPTGYVFSIAFDSLPQDQLSNSTPTVDIGSSSNRIVFCATQGANGVDSVTAVTWNTTESFTKQQAQQTPGGRFQTIWSLTPVGTGSHSAAIVGTLDIETFIVYSGVAQTSQPHNATVNSGTGTSSTLTITTSASTDWLFGSFANAVAAQSPSAGTTKRSGGSNSVNSASDSNGTVSPTTLGYTWTGSGAWGAVGVSFSQFSAPATNGNFLSFM